MQPRRNAKGCPAAQRCGHVVERELGKERGEVERRVGNVGPGLACEAEHERRTDRMPTAPEPQEDPFEVQGAARVFRQRAEQDA